MIFTDDQGRPIPKPVRADYTTDLAFIEARHEWARKLSSIASSAVYTKRAPR